jgi:hypothetical protein
MYQTAEQGNKKHAEAYKKGLTTIPNPDALEPVNFDDKKFKGKDGNGDWELMAEAYDRNHAVIRGWDDTAKKTRAWVGRTLQDGVGDGYAVYVVVKENKKTVRVKVCRGLGDDWVSRHFGEESSVDKVQASNFFPWNFHEKRILPHDLVEKK